MAAPALKPPKILKRWYLANLGSDFMICTGGRICQDTNHSGDNSNMVNMVTRMTNIIVMVN